MEKIGLRRILVSDGPVGRARRGLGRARPVAQPAVGDRAGLGLGPRHRPPLRRRGRGRGPPQGRRRRARPDHQPAPLPARRPALRVLQRGPGPHRRPRGGVRARRPGQRRRRHPEALHRQRLRDRPLHRRRPGRRAAAARALPAGLREGHHRGAGLAGDELLQLGQRRHRRPRTTCSRRRSTASGASTASSISDWTAVRSLDSARASQDLVDARTRTARGARRWSRPSRPATSTSRSSTARCCASCGSPQRVGALDGTAPRPSPCTSRTVPRSPARPPPRAWSCCERNDGDPAAGTRSASAARWP